ncbi:helicase domain protein [Mycobacterium kansasii]|uniref:Helicase domain protein n=1 Tax=Mycobacterium kansasii TaxID=1768 RepID=A0A1V3WIP1_MYCKA|nr:helicase domain protein [Mycobacterium kansasii]
MDYVREQVADPKLSAVRQRVRWWSAIALLRCLASSPAAAEQTLLNRSAVAAVENQDEVDAFAEPGYWTPIWTTPWKEKTSPSAPIPVTSTRRQPVRAGGCANWPGPQRL